jgi:hypothetical protein
MANFTVVTFIEDDLSLPDLEEVLNQKEDLLRGPVLAISPCTDIVSKRLICVTFAKAGKPDKPIALKEISNGAIPTIPGRTLVCIGRCFVKGIPLEVAAFR